MKVKETLIIIILGFLPFVMVIGNSMFIPVLPTIERKLSINSVEAGLLLTVFSISASFVIPFVGFLAERFSRKKIILLSLLLVALGCIISGVSAFFSKASFPLLLGGRAVQGLGAGGTAPLAMAVIGETLTGANRSKALGILEVFNGLGKMLSPLIGMAVIMVTWYTAFWVYFFIAMITFVGIYVYIDQNEKPSEQTLKEYGYSLVELVIKNFRWLLPVYMTGGVVLFVLFGLLVYFSYEIETVYTVSGIEKGILFALPLGMMTLMAYITGRFIGESSDRLKQFLCIGLALLFIPLIIAMLEHSFIGLIFIITTIAAGAGILLPCCNFFVVTNVLNEERGMAVSFYGMVRFLGVAFGPLVYSQWMYDEWWMFMYSLLITLGATLWLYSGWLSLSKEEAVTPFTNH